MHSVSFEEEQRYPPYSGGILAQIHSYTLCIRISPSCRKMNAASIWLPCGHPVMEKSIHRIWRLSQ